MFEAVFVILLLALIWRTGGILDQLRELSENLERETIRMNDE